MFCVESIWFGGKINLKVKTFFFKVRSCLILIPVRWGIMQGCPISGQLYRLVIEPLLSRLQDNLISLLVTDDSVTLVVIAYADDVNVFIREQADIKILKKRFLMFI